MEQSNVDLSYEEKVSLDELVKQAETEDNNEEQSLAIVAENEGQDKVAIANKVCVITGVLKNQTQGPLHILGQPHKWAGHIVKNFPDPLNSVGMFSMSALSDKGIKIGVVYTGKNRAGVECAWLFAFACCKDLGGRIYGEVGKKGKFINIDWNDIEEKLKYAGAIAKAHDDETNTGLYATTVGTQGKTVVAAAFTG